ncbi:MAG: MBL fold metallo-hydrolase [Clostridiaceae bacterium]
MRKRSYAPIILIIILVLGLIGIYVMLDYGIIGVEKSSDVSRIQMVKAPIKVHFIDVGQGDSILLQVNDKNILIDAGEEDQSQIIIDYLKTYDIEKLDMVFLTHPHEDHIGGMGEVLNSFSIGEFYAPNKVIVTTSYERMASALKSQGKVINDLTGGMEFTFDNGISLSILSPNKPSYLSPNNYSPIMRLSMGNSAFLFTGDAEELIETEVLKAGLNVTANILKAPHHGSKTSSSVPFLEKVAPEYIIVTSDEGNDHNLPSPEILARYNGTGAKTLLTEEMGNIVFSTNGKEVLLLSN